MTALLLFGSEAISALCGEFAQRRLWSPITLEVGTQKLCMIKIDTGNFHQKFFVNF